MVAQADTPSPVLSRLSSLHFSLVLLAVSALLMIAHYLGVLPAWLVRYISISTHSSLKTNNPLYSAFL